MKLSRAFHIAAVLAVGLGCGRPPDTTQSAARASGRNVDVAAPMPICIGAVCTPRVGGAVTLGPLAPPTMVTGPLGPVAPPALPIPMPSVCLQSSVSMQVLVLSADGTEPTLQAIQQALGYHAIPYTTWIASQNPGLLTPDKLSTGCSGNYQGVILATGDLVHSPDGGVTWVSALTAPEWLALRSYEQSFKIREVSWYVYPGAAQGLNPPSSGFDTTNTPVQATLTATGRTVFPSVNAENPLPVSKAWTYLATPADPNVVPLLVDSSGNALVSSRATADGRETMALTFDSNPYLIHDLVLAHGLVEWVTKGLYLGEFRAYTAAQNDDIFIDDDMYLAAEYPSGVFRMSDADLNATMAWQKTAKLTAKNPDFRIAYAFNGSGGSDTDPLTIAIKANSGEFDWINHTFDHENLDGVTYDFAYDQFIQNIQFAQRIGLQNFTPMELVTPDVSGLTTAAALKAAWDAGVRYTISDTSKAGWDNPAPNIGIWSTLQSGLFIIPRKPTNLFYNVSYPDEWAAEYNSFYRSYWGRDLTYAEILDKESDNLLLYLLQGNIDPTMYHQPNTRAYDGVHTLLGDLLDTAFAKFRTYSTLPIMSPAEHVIGPRMQNTMARNASGLTATIATLATGKTVSFTSPVTVDFAVTGICTATSEQYAGECITNVHVDAGQTVTFATL